MPYLELYAIKVTQPLSDFYITSIKAKNLIDISFSEQLQYTDETGRLQGNQRKIDVRRLKEIGRYIESVEMSFPNSIIIAANYDENGQIIDDESKRWDIVHIQENLYKLIVPTSSKLAAVIDGQHRLNGFNYIDDNDKLNVELPCSIFFDLPNSYQAFLFATINGNQKRVDKSLALEQFGFNVEEEPQHSWTPEKLAVFFTRQLNFRDSPLKGHIKIAPIISNELRQNLFQNVAEWTISTATIVDGILGLITSNAKRDRVEMAQENIWGKRTRGMVEKFTSDKSPLRDHYLRKEDDYIFMVITNFLQAAKKTVWKDFDPKSYIFKTVGVQAVFDLLKRILQKRTYTEESQFLEFLNPSSKYDFSSSSIQASGIGRRDIRNALLLSSGIIDAAILEKTDLKKIREFET